jgi:hypothetical protein
MMELLLVRGAVGEAASLCGKGNDPEIVAPDTPPPAESLGPLDHSLLAYGAKPDFDPFPGQQIRKPLAPFDQHHRVALEDFIQT